MTKPAFLLVKSPFVLLIICWKIIWKITILDINHQAWNWGPHDSPLDLVPIKRCHENLFSHKIGGCIMIMYYYVIFYSFHMFPCLWFAILTPYGMAFFFIPGCSRSNFRSDVVAKSPRVDAALRHPPGIRQRRTWRTGRNPGGNMQQNHRTSTKMSYSMREIWWNM